MKQIFSWRSVKLVLMAVFFALAGSLVYTKVVYGAIPSLIGGTVTSLTYCPVETTFAIEVDGVAGIGGGTFVYLPGASDVYAYYQIYRPGVNVKGLGLPGSTCRGFGRRGFFDILSPSGYIVMVGTSL